MIFSSGWQTCWWTSEKQVGIFLRFLQTCRWASEKQIGIFLRCLTNMSVILLKNKSASFSGSNKHISELLKKQIGIFLRFLKTCPWAYGRQVDELVKWLAKISVSLWQSNQWASILACKYIGELQAKKSMCRCVSGKQVVEILQCLVNMSANFSSDGLTCSLALSWCGFRHRRFIVTQNNDVNSSSLTNALPPSDLGI